MFILGASHDSQVGRYRMSVTVQREFTVVYVIDTTNGVVKYVDPKNEGKPFTEIK
jgi:hypothetical protein